MDVLQIPSGDLAYLGDSVLEVLVRRKLILDGHSGAGRLNRLAASYVTAVSQSLAMDRILPVLTETEEGVFRRARNQTKSSVPGSATVAQYRKASGMEALFAYLYLSNQKERMNDLFELAYPDSEIE
jgi:ribonuclease-3 family protein